LGEVEVELGRTVEGLHHLKESLAKMDPTDARRAIIQRNADEAYAKTAHVAIRTKAGATVSVDGAAAPGVAPFPEPIDVLPGKRVLEARLEDRTARQEIEAPPGSVIDVELAVPESVAPPAAQAALPIAPLAVAPAAQRPASSPSWWTVPRMVGVALGAGAAAGLGLGIYFHTAAVNAMDDGNAIRANPALRDACSSSSSLASCASLRSKVDSTHQDNTAAKVTWAIAGAAAAGSVVAFVVGIHGPDRPSASVVVRPTIGLGVVGIEGSF
jgi:hypothetical protein